jgi:hypothetical protein
MQAFWELSSCRAFGMSLGPIPWTAIVEYAERKGLDSSMIPVFEVVMRELDECYLTDLREQQRQRESQSERRLNKERKRG